MLNHVKRRFVALFNQAERAFVSTLEGASKGSRRVLFLIFAGAAVASSVVFVIAVGLAFVHKEAGQFGDFFGGTLNPILTFLTFIGLIMTIVLQQSELKETREELARSADALEAQIKSVSQQSFESTLFQSIALHNDIVDRVKISYQGETKVGREAFETFSLVLRDLNKPFSEDDGNQRVAAYERFWMTYRKDLAHYFRVSYNVLRLIHDSNVERTKYVRIFRCLFSDAELEILFYNGLTERGTKYKRLIEANVFLNNLPFDRLYHATDRDLYSSKAFGNRRSGPDGHQF